MKANDLDFKIALEAIDKTYNNNFKPTNELIKEISKKQVFQTKYNSKKINKIKQFGFESKVFKNIKSGKYIICFCGTNDIIDYISDIEMAKNRVPPQLIFAINTLKNLEHVYGISINQIEMITGHSLGGSLAQLIGSMKEYSHIKVVTFNAYGTAKIRSFKRKGENITNYISENDIIATIEKHIGNNIKIPMGEKAKFYKELIEYIKNKRIQTGENLYLLEKYCQAKFLLFSHSEELESVKNKKLEETIEKEFEKNKEKFEKSKENVEKTKKKTFDAITNLDYRTRILKNILKNYNRLENDFLNHEMLKTPIWFNHLQNTNGIEKIFTQNFNFKEENIEKELEKSSHLTFIHELNNQVNKNNLSKTNFEPEENLIIKTNKKEIEANNQRKNKNRVEVVFKKVNIIDRCDEKFFNEFIKYFRDEIIEASLGRDISSSY